VVEPINITGRWIGSYRQHERDNPITAIFAQVDGNLQGKMTDGITKVDQSVFDAAFEAGLPPGADEQIVVLLRKEFPDAPRTPIRAQSNIPEFSTLEGEIRGRDVRFLKEYIGDHFNGWLVGDKLIGTTIADHSVQYAGTLSEDGKSIEGRWTVSTSRKRDSATVSGSFILRREDD
jgi:hypothetical protein